MLLALALAHAESPVVEGPLPPPPALPGLTVTEIETAHRAERAYHVRFITFGAVSLAGGITAMALSEDDPVLLHFGLHNAIGGAANLAFGAIALPRPRPAPSPAGLGRLRETMALNVGLDIGYVLAGLAMGFLGDEHPAIEGAGWGIATQGAQLAIMDTIFLLKLPKLR